VRDCTTAVVLAAGLGSRMRREAADTLLDPAQAAAAARGLKGMIPDSRGRPFLDHVLSSLADGGITDVCVVVGESHAAIREHCARQPARRLRIGFATQETPRGTADALLVAETWVAGRDFLVLNADNLYPAAAIRALVELGAPGLVAFAREALIRESNIDPGRIAAFAVLDVREDDTLAAIVEKPTDAQLRSAGASDWISMNIWRFDTEIFAACRDVRPSPRGELELPLAVALAVDRGTTMRVVRMATGVLDLSSRADVMAIARALGDRDIQP
jgi:glucose-1-phosphate thymidylyltransferase